MVRRQTWRVKFDRIVIETTGLADPGPVLQTFLADAYLSRKYYVDGVVTVADAATGHDTLDRQFEAVSQIATADLIVVSKTDLVSEKMSEAFQARLRSLNPTTSILKADHGIVPTQALWCLSGMRRNVQSKQALSWLTQEAASNPLDNLTGLAPRQAPSPLPHGHDARIGSASIILDTPISPAAFDLWLDTLIQLRGPDILRVKGIVHLEDIETPFVFHGVQHLFDPPIPLRDWPDGDTQSRIVVIARDMTNPELNRSLDMLRAHPSTKTKTRSP